MTQYFKISLLLLLVACFQTASCQSNQDVIAERSYKEAMKSYSSIFEESIKEKQEISSESERLLDATSLEEVKQFRALVDNYQTVLDSFLTILIAYPKPHSDINTGARFFNVEGNQEVIEAHLKKLFDFYKNSEVLYIGNDGIDIYFKNQFSFGKVVLSSDILHLKTLKISMSSAENAILKVLNRKHQ